MRLHRAAHFRRHLGDGFPVLLVVQPRQARKGPLGRVLGQVLAARILLEEFDHRLGGRLAEDEQVRERIRAEAVGAVDRGAGAFPRRVEARDYRLGISPLRHNDLAEIVGRDAAHHVMHCRHHGDGVLHRIDIGEFLRDLADARQPLVDHFGPEMVQLQ